MKRSAIAFARGARTGVRTMLMSAAAKTASNAGCELAVPVAGQEPEPVGAVAEIHEQVAGLLGHPGTGRVGGDPGDVHAATLVFDDDEDGEAAQVDGAGRRCRRGRSRPRGSHGPARTGTVARSARTVGARDRAPLPSRSSRRSRLRRSRLARNGRVRPTRPGSVCSPSGDSREPSAAPGPDRSRIAGAVGGRPGRRFG